MQSSYLRTAVASMVVGVVGLVSYGFVRELQSIGDGKIVIATGSSQYFELGS